MTGYYFYPGKLVNAKNLSIKVQGLLYLLTLDLSKSTFDWYKVHVCKQDKYLQV